MTDGPPARGFERVEFKARQERAQRLMQAADFDALLVTSEQHVQYFTGFVSQFWASPTRPWFVVVPAKGALVAVVPEIGGSGMAATWVEDVRTWPAPMPDDDGVSLLADALIEIAGPAGCVGTELGSEMVLRMPINDFEWVRDLIKPVTIADGTQVLRELRGIKSVAEVEKIRHVCEIVSDAFEALLGKLRAGMNEWEASREMRIDVLKRGADTSPYMMGSAGAGGYDNIIMGPTNRVIKNGDILILDTGTTFDGYYCDFDRNYAFGAPDDDAQRAYDVVFQATEAGLAAARPGATTTDLWRAMNEALEAGGALGNNVGRLGHGLGVQLTEWPSNKAGDNTKLVPGMVLTIEPGMEFKPGQMMVHEENIVVTEDGCKLLTRRAPDEMWVID